MNACLGGHVNLSASETDSDEMNTPGKDFDKSCAFP